jgi:prepilin-type N-terminal cleavage/methylation domain-containing protein
MPRFRQSNSAPAPQEHAGRAQPASRGRARREGGRGRAFTLIELIFVLALLAIAATFVVAHMGGFFRGRALNFEARRMLSLSQYGQSRAISEGVPVVLWVNTKDGTYGLTIQSSFTDEEGDLHATTYTVEPSLSLETPVGDTPPVSEDDDENLGLPEGYAALRFNPDGFVDESSVTRVVIRQGTEAALAVAPTTNRLACEIRPLTNLE